MKPSSRLIETLGRRALPAGGFSFFPGGGYRSDATAWAAIGLKSAGAGDDLVDPALDRLAKEQSADGSLVTSPDAPGASWVTSLAILAWNGSGRHKENVKRSLEFLYKTPGKHWKRRASDPVAHDFSIRGWPWTSDTHSWVAPTSYGLLALAAEGQSGHPCAEEAARMVMDRQLDTGGWNYGNTFVYGTRLYPQPDQTGLALCALRPHAQGDEVSRSLGYLAGEVGRIGTPLSLGWALMGLAAWGKQPPDSMRRVEECVKRQERTAAYSSQELSVLLLAISRVPRA